MRVQIPFHVLDKRGRPVQGATVKAYLRWNADGTVNYPSSNPTEAKTYANASINEALGSLTTDTLGQINAWVDEGQYAVVISGNNLAESVMYFEAGAANVKAKDGDGTFTRAGVTISTAGIEVDNDTVISFRSDNSVSFQTIPDADKYETEFDVSMDPSKFYYSSGTSATPFFTVKARGDQLFNFDGTTSTYASSVQINGGSGDGRLTVTVPDIPNLSTETAGTSTKTFVLGWDWASISAHADTNSFTTSSNPVSYQGRYWKANVAINARKAITAVAASGTNNTTWTYTSTAHGFSAKDVVTIYGISGATMYNGQFTIDTVPDANTFTVIGPQTPSGTATYTGAYVYDEPSISKKWDQVFPFTGTFYSKTTSSSSTTNQVTLSNATNLSTGMYVYGTGVPFGVRIESISSSTLTLSANVAVANAATLYFGSVPYIPSDDTSVARSIYGYKNKVLSDDGSTPTTSELTAVLKDLIADLKRYGLIS